MNGQTHVIVAIGLSAVIVAFERFMSLTSDVESNPVIQKTTNSYVSLGSSASAGALRILPCQFHRRRIFGRESL